MVSLRLTVNSEVTPKLGYVRVGYTPTGAYTQTTSASLLRLETHDPIFGESLSRFFSNCARGYFGSTVGRDEAVIRDYIRTQEQEDKRIDRLNMWR
jgi:hypothetical protein